MAKIHKAKKAAPKSKIDRLKSLLLGIIVFLLFLISWQIIAYHQRKEDIANKHQVQLTQELNQAGLNLNEIEMNIIRNGVAGQTTKSHYCYHASRKFEKEPIYCVQKLDILATNATDDRIIEDFSAISNILNNNAPLAPKKVVELSSFDTNGRIFQYLSPAHDSSIINCSMTFNGNSSSFRNTNNRNNYEVSIECLGGDFIKNIYPMKKE